MVATPERSEGSRYCRQFPLDDFLFSDTIAEGPAARRWGMVRARRVTPHESERRARTMLSHEPSVFSDVPERSDDSAARSAGPLPRS